MVTEARLRSNRRQKQRTSLPCLSSSALAAFGETKPSNRQAFFRKNASLLARASDGVINKTGDSISQSRTKPLAAAFS